MQAAAEFVAEAIFSGHQCLAVVVAGLLEAAFQLLHAMVAIEGFGLGVDYIGAVVEGSLRVGLVAVLPRTVGRTGVGEAVLDERLHQFAAHLVELRSGEEPASLGLVDHLASFEGGVAEFGELFHNGLSHPLGVFGGNMFVDVCDTDVQSVFGNARQGESLVGG